MEHTRSRRIWCSDETAFADEISSLLTQVYLNSRQKNSEEQKRELQERLERAERMESLGILAGGVAHDLNNILGPMVGYSELILRQLDNTEKIEKRVKRIGQSAQEAADVIQDLLTLARRGRYEMVPTDLNQIIMDFLESPAFLSLKEQRPEVEIVANLDDSLGRMLGSTPHLMKVIMNLIFNAFDAITGEGKVYVITSCPHLEKLSNGFDLGDLSGNLISLCVKDTGNGIAPENLEKIFEPYFSKKKLGRSSGSGLGLSVVYGVIKDHHGYYDIISTPGLGTEFNVFFPVVDAEDCEPDTARKKIEGTETILIVDDNPVQLEIAEEMISSLGYSVTIAASGENAVEYLKSNEADLVILDMIMDPGIDGLDTYREILKIRTEQKAIITSGFSATERVEEMQKLGAGQYIRKPYSLSAVGGAIREELDKVHETIPT
jgi:signal transduction histidine kinase/CheY-like chemotaxis protein